MASLYDVLCYHSLTSTDPLLEELLCYLPTRFQSRIFDYIAYEHSSDDESVHSVDSSFSAFYSNDSTLFSEVLFYLSFFATPKFLPRRRAQDIQKGRRPRMIFDPKEGPRPQIKQKLPASASSSNCSRLSWAVQAGNSRSQCRRLKLVSWLYPAEYARSCSIKTSPTPEPALLPIVP